MRYISWSQLSKYNWCSMGYKLHYLDHIETPASPDMLVGEAVHIILAWLSTIKLATGTLPDVYNVISRGSADANPQRVRDMVETYLADFAIKPLDNPEQAFCLDLGCKLPFFGFIDYVEAIDEFRGAVVDYKTTSKPWDKRKQKRYNLQAQIYLSAANKIWPATIWQFEFRVIHPKGTQRIIVPPQEDWQQEVDDTITKIENGSFFFAEEWKCHYCDLEAHCYNARLLEGEF